MDTRSDSLYAAFHTRLMARPDATLLITETGRVWRRGDIEAQTARLAGSMRELGVRPGDRVSVQVEKSPQALCLYLACLRAGFVFHPLNPAYKPAELQYFLGDAEPALVVCDPASRDLVRPLVSALGEERLLTLDSRGGGSLMLRARESQGMCATTSCGRDDLAALLYSSGTTGIPKGIELTHGNLAANARTLVAAWGFTEGDRLLHALPIFHVHGLFVALGCVLLAGASMRWLPRFDAAEVMRFLPESTVMMGVPTYYTRLLAQRSFSRDVTRNVRLFVSGSAPLLTETFHQFERRTGLRILERYGMTETNMNTSNPLDGERKPGTVGPPLAGVDVRIVDASGAVLPVGEVGDLQVKGANVFRRYWRLPEKTAEDFTPDGFFNTGDKASIGEDGYVTLVGRARDMIISGGLNVYPKEIEACIDEVAGVLESAVIGVPHPDLGEGVVAVVVCNEDTTLTAAAVVAELRSDLAGFKLPKAVVFAAKLPRNTMGKVQKNRLREQHANLFSR